ncbi:MAG TPA: cytidylate kinase-like family protein [Thermoanaerobaculia bacterium]|nr:cytidylate kinase-like family protein [Thermoanaerobaculia bacterium]
MTSTLPGVELADRQGRFKEMRRRATEDSPAGPAQAEGPWIALSRQLGSGGSEVAALLGAALGWRIYDREILQAVAAETRRDERTLERFDEKGVRTFGEYLAPLILPADPGQSRYLVDLTHVVRRLGREGRAVLVGRGANFILDPAHGLRVRAVAPAPDRAEALAHDLGLPLDEAHRRIAASDTAQREFVWQAFQREIEDPAGYDLVVHPRALGLPAAVAAILAAARAKLEF